LPVQRIGYLEGMEKVVTLSDVRTAQTSNGNTRFIARDGEGNEFTTFREEIGGRARALQGRRVRVSYHEVQRGQFTNVYLDAIEPVDPDPVTPPAAAGDTDPQEAAWRTAVEAAPWLVGTPDGTVEPEELYEKLKPFEERVAADIEAGRQE
jgi:hypothetical protein